MQSNRGSSPKNVVQVFELIPMVTIEIGLIHVRPLLSEPVIAFIHRRNNRIHYKVLESFIPTSTRMSHPMQLDFCRPIREDGSS